MPKKAKETITQKVLKNTSYNFLTALISKIGAFVFTVIIARVLFPELFGIYTLALTIILTIATFTDLGLNATLIRYISESLKTKTSKSEQQARARFYFLLNLKLVFTAITALALFLLSDIISFYLFKKPLLALPLKIGSIYLFVISVQGFFSSIFYSLQKINYSLVAETIFQCLRIILVLLFLSLYKSIGTIFISLSIALFVSFLFLYFTLSRKYAFLLKGKKARLEQGEKKRLLSFFGWLTISSISLVFFVHIDTFMLGLFLPAEFIGYYGAIFSIVGTVAAFVGFGSVLLPVFTQLEQGKLERGFNKVFHYVSLIAIPAAIGLAFVIVPAIQIIYGQAYVPSSYKFAITITSVLLSLLVIESALTAIYSALFQAKERPKIPSVLIVMATIANIILNYLFIKIGISIAPQYGLIGVALATVITRYFNLIALAIISKKKFNVKAKASSILKPLIVSIIMLTFLFILGHFFVASILTEIALIILGALVYFVIMLAIKGIKTEDFKMIITLRLKK